MEPENIQSAGLCCCCGSPLNSSEHLNFLQINVKATWSFPVWGNLITGEENMACAFICDHCYEVGQTVPLTMKTVVEINDNSILYHPLTVRDGAYQLIHEQA